MDAGRPSPSPKSSKSQSRRAQDSPDAAEFSHHFGDAFRSTVVGESEGGATHSASAATGRPTSPTHGERKAPLKDAAAPKRLRSNNETVEQPVAGPSRTTQAYDDLDTLRGGPGVLTTEETSEIDGVVELVTSVGRPSSPVGVLLYPDAEPDIHAAGTNASSLMSPHSHRWPGDLSHGVGILGPGQLRTRLAAEASSSTIGSMSLARLLNFEDEGEERPASSSAAAQPRHSTPQPAESRHRPPLKLSGYNCPICFSPPTYATVTPCGHVCCAECLFTAVKTSIQRSMYHGPASSNAKCPVCRALIPGWDGKGGGVIGLKAKLVHDISGSPTKFTS